MSISKIKAELKQKQQAAATSWAAMAATASGNAPPTASANKSDAEAEAEGGSADASVAPAEDVVSGAPEDQQGQTPAADTSQTADASQSKEGEGDDKPVKIMRSEVMLSRTVKSMFSKCLYISNLPQVSYQSKHAIS